ncbi:MAG: OPT family oligopeptide transporter [Myxococcota bacterium]
MALFQSPPSTPAELERSRPLDLTPEQVQEMGEAEWYERVYRGDDVPQLTVRAVLVGSALGFVLAFTNLYVGLMTGWGLGVAITACILSYALWNGLLRVGLAKTPLTILETNCMQSTASAAGYSTGSTMISAVAALLMLSATDDNPQGQHLSFGVLMLWTGFLAVLGISVAVPMKRTLINNERLKFPSGTAAAVTLQSLYSQGDSALRQARALLVTGAVGALFPLVIDLRVLEVLRRLGLSRLADALTLSEGQEGLIPASVPIFDWLPARGTHLEDGVAVANKPSNWTMALDLNPVMIAAGMIVGLRIAVSMLAAGLLLAYVVGPYGAEQHWTSLATGNDMLATSAPHRAWKEIGIWLGVPIMVSSSLMQFALQWRTIGRAFSGLFGGSVAEDDRVLATEVPTSWFAAGVAVGGAGVTGIASWQFHVPVYYGVLAVILTFALCLVAARATGESDITPIGGMGKIMQLTYGILIPQSATANLMTAAITASSASSSADLLNDLKSGYLLGANPRRQFLAQLFGAISGTLATVVGFRMLVPDATFLNGVGDLPPRFPAPAAQSWKAVAEVFSLGIENLHPVYQNAIGLGLAIGVVLVVLELALPKVRAFLPSATGLGLGMILPFQYPLSMFLGALAAWLWTRQSPKSAEQYLIAVASGLIAGISILGVLVAFFNNFVL